jgi:hypothetical protein
MEHSQRLPLAGRVVWQRIDASGRPRNRRKVGFYQHFRLAARAAEAFGHHRHHPQTDLVQTIE